MVRCVEFSICAARFTLLMYGLAELAGDLIFCAVSVVGGANGMIADPSYHTPLLKKRKRREH